MYKLQKKKTDKPEYVKVKNFYLSKNILERITQAVNVTNHRLISDIKRTLKSINHRKKIEIQAKI